MAQQRLIIIGLDGVGLEQARYLAGRGVMPHLAKLLHNGQAWTTRSPLPEVSPVCWGTMFSGKNPGEHGVFGFGHPVAGSYRVMPVNSTGFKAPRIWDLATKQGLESVVLNVPLTYPARPLKGSMVSGFVVPSLKRAVYPPRLLDLLEDSGYRPEADMDLGVDNHLELIADLDQVITARLEVFSQMLEQKWDLYLAVITDSDRINHFFWQALHDPGHPPAEQVLGLYTRIDSFLGHIWQEYGTPIRAGEMNLLVVADHSFGPIETEVYLNRWLIEQGYLQVALNDGAEKILPQTSALALDPGRIYLHRADRFPNGAVFYEKQRSGLLAEISANLLQLKHPKSGRSCIRKVHYKEELYHGPYLDEAPDLVVQAVPGVSLRAGLGMPGVFGLSHLQGAHLPEGAMALWLGSPLESNPDKVQDLLGLMSHALGLEDAAAK